MYLPRQIVFDYDIQAPIQIPADVWSFPSKRTSPFLNQSGVVSLPDSIEQAKQQILAGEIYPAPLKQM